MLWWRTILRIFNGVGIATSKHCVCSTNNCAGHVRVLQMKCWCNQLVMKLITRRTSVDNARCHFYDAERCIIFNK